MIEVAQNQIFDYDYIKNLKFISDLNEEVEIEVGLNLPIYKTIKILEGGGYITNIPKGNVCEINWNWGNNNLVRINDNNGKTLFAYPTLDLKKMIVIYGEDSSVYPNPNNAVIYNVDGSKIAEIKSPDLISATAKSQAPIYEKWFDMVCWKKDSWRNIVCALRIRFDRYFFEERAFDVETGKFGEVLMEGRY